MKTTLLVMIALLAFASAATAQQAVTIGGFVRMEGAVPEDTRVGVHVIDLDGNTLEELASTGLVAGTFSMTTPSARPMLSPFTDGAVPLPGLQSDYRVSPTGVNYARAVTKVYTDSDESGDYTPGVDGGFVSIATLESGGFFVLLFVDQDATLTGRGASVDLLEGWNVFAVQAGAEGELRFVALERVDDIVLDTFRP